MKKSKLIYMTTKNAKKLCVKIIITVSLVAMNLMGVGQDVSSYTSTIISGTYVAHSGTSILDNVDNAISAVTDIGFTFEMGGESFTQFRASSNGFIRLGNTAPATNLYTPISTTSNIYSIAAAARDGRTHGGVQVETQGSEPNRVCVIQYTNYRISWQNDANNRISFQIKLYETSNIIEIIYFPTEVPNRSEQLQIGLRGSSTPSDFNNLMGESTDWATLTSGTANDSRVRISETLYPSEGRIFRWTPPGSPILSVDPSSLDFGYTASGNNSESQSYTLSGDNLEPESGDITVTAPTGFEVSLNDSDWSGSVSPSYTGGEINTTIYVRFSPTGAPDDFSGNITNTGGEATTQNVAVTGTSILEYCNAGPSWTTASDLFRVQISGPGTTFDHNVGCTGITGTQDFTGMSGINLQQGETYAMTITMGQCGTGTWGNVAKAWIDWNVDGDFDEPGEQLGVVQGATSSAGVVYSFDFTVPIGADLGETRLRVMQYETGNAGLVIPCATYSWGSVHDYTVNVLELPLPIELISFDVTCLCSEVLIEWITATEINNDYFIIEKSKDAENWSEVTRIDGAGFSNKQLEYKFVDKNPYEGDNYYRLTQVDYDGTFKTFGMVYTHCILGYDISIYPNPFTSELFIEFDNRSQMIYLYDMSGRLVEVYKTVSDKMILQLGHLKTGQYIIVIKNGDIFKQKIIKERY